MSFAFIMCVAVLSEISKEGIEKIRHAVEARKIADSWESGKYYYDNVGTTEIVVEGVKVPEKPKSDDFLILNQDRTKWIKYEDASKEDLEMYEQEYKRYFKGDIPKNEVPTPSDLDPAKIAKREAKKAKDFLIAENRKEAIKSQEEVIKALDEAIKKQTKNKNNSNNQKNNSSSSNSSGKGSSQSSTSSTTSAESSGDPNGNPQPVDINELREKLANKLWGQLKNRNEKFNSKNIFTEEFLPHYREEIENYFKNLAKDSKFK